MGIRPNFSTVFGIDSFSGNLDEFDWGSKIPLPEYNKEKPFDDFENFQIEVGFSTQFFKGCTIKKQQIPEYLAVYDSLDEAMFWGLADARKKSSGRQNDSF